MVAIPARNTDEGAETRLLLAECRGPSFPGYNLADATRCMQLMDLVLWNRVNNNPAQFLARHATLVGVITARGQFQGFEHYPNYDSRIVHNIQTMIHIANNARDRRTGDFSDFITAAIRVAGSPSIPDPSQGLMAAWRTTGSSSPGSKFAFFTTVLSTDFYSI